MRRGKAPGKTADEKSAADPTRELARLRRQLKVRDRDLADKSRVICELLDQQAASADILRAIASTPGEPQRALDTIAEAAARMFSASNVNIRVVEGDRLRAVGTAGSIAKNVRFGFPHIPIDRSSLIGTVVLNKRPVHVADPLHPTDEERSPLGGGPVLEVSARAGRRTTAAVPMMREGEAIGGIIVIRTEVRPFTDDDLALLQSFADQAVIAIENARLLTELQESLDRQTAMSEVLGVISSSPGELQPVFDSMLEHALRLCQASVGVLLRSEGEAFRPAAHRGHSEALGGAITQMGGLLRPGPSAPLADMARGRRTVQVADLAATQAYRDGDATVVLAVERGNVKTSLLVPILKDGDVIGAFVIHRSEVKPFTDKQIALVENFAGQAVIAIENARLLAELNARNRDLAASLEQQTATSDILRAIASSPGEAEYVLGSICETAMRLFGASSVGIRRIEDNVVRLVASAGIGLTDIRQAHRDRPLDLNGYTGVVVLKNRQVHIPDMHNPPPGILAGDTTTDVTRVSPRSGNRTVAFTPLAREGKVLGVMVVHRSKVRPFSDKELALMTGFADQAVIAIENARLLTELRESLDRRIAIAEVLQVISSSPGELQPVFEAMLESAVRLCDAWNGSVFRIEGETFRRVTGVNLAPELAAQTELRFAPELPAARMLASRATVHVPDVMAELFERPDHATLRIAAERTGARSALWVPMVKDDEVVAAFVLSRREARAFTDSQIGLVENFASQAVIAIENARLLSELREALGNQTASTEILRTIASAPAEAAQALSTIAQVTARLFTASTVNIHRVEGDRAPPIGGAGPAYDRIRALDFRSGPSIIKPDSVPGAVILEKRQIQVADLENPDPSMAHWRGVQAARAAGTRSVVGTPLMRQGEAIGALVVHRSEARAFTDRELAQLTNFADQAVIAIENAKLLSELRAARDAAEQALGELRAAQANLIQSEKMASLGQLTAGIAHEIKNPLNFVNNFAGLSVELFDELKEAQSAAVAVLGPDKKAEVDEIVATLTGNLEKIAEHGRRADGIVKSMLAHSRGGSGERQQVNMNALVEESLNLAFHGARAQDQSFTVTLERDLDPNLKPVEVVPQDLTRVFLNLFGNGFYAANKRRREGAEADFAPTLRVATRDAEGNVEIRIRDNGAGIVPDIRDKLFQPFFTTKPTGEGTGLGLSISYEIVTRQHGGTIAVASEPGSFTEFTVTIPKKFGTAKVAENRSGNAES